MTVHVTVDGSGGGNATHEATVTLERGANVYDALVATGITHNARSTVYGTYVSAIDGLAERDRGPQSGWMYSVNGVTPMVACSGYELSDGDVVRWYYVNAE